jgi:hypothetical protein
MRLILLLAVVLIGAFAADIEINNDLIFREVSRGIDLTTNLARHKVSITINNAGSKEVFSFSKFLPFGSLSRSLFLQSSLAYCLHWLLSLFADVVCAFDCR